MDQSLSIVIPCYNCTATLAEAVNSIFLQNFTIPFEIIMVDDKSKDNTIDLMQKLAATHPEIKLIYHPYNKGGGATRNTGIKESRGELIFCLDSDNLLYPDSMQKMVDFIKEKKCDGAVIHERRYFKENDQIHYEAYFNNITSPITFENLFAENAAILDNFLFTRESYNKTSGYPEEHGFDTQCFEVRFLAAGNSVVVCPGSIFLHRQAILTKGYFHRVYEEGLFSVNMYLIYEEIMYLFSQESICDIIEYDVFTRNKLGQDNIKAFFAHQYKKNGDGIFRENFKTYLIPQGIEKYLRDLVKPKTLANNFVKAVILYREKKYKDAYELYLQLSTQKPHSKIIKYNLVRCKLALEGNMQTSLIEHEALRISGCKPVKRKMSLKNNLLKSLIFYIKKFYEKSA